MDIVKTILVVAFVIVCILLVLLVLVQNEDNNGMGSAFGGGQSTAFGAHGASILTKTTGVLIALFFVIVFAIAVINAKTGDGKKSAAELGAETETTAESTADSTDAGFDALYGTSETEESAE